MKDNQDKGKSSRMKQDESLRNLLAHLDNEISSYTSHLTLQIERLADIGMALSSEHDLDNLLEMIMDEARRFTLADAGTLYLTEDGKLAFKILQNESMGVRMGGSSGVKITLPPVELSRSNVSAHVAMTGKAVNIPDVYKAKGFDFTGPRKYDKETGYRSKSMLVIPLKDHEDVIIGVLQLLNAKDPKSKEVIPFSKDFENLTMSLASQAAVAISNSRLITGMENLIDSIVNVMATAIDERSPYTGGHIMRVAELGVKMCEAINEQETGPFSSKSFSKDQIKEMEIAGKMHDIGKITTPVHIVDKATKLQTLYDRVDLINTRFMLIEAMERTKWLERKLEMQKNGDPPESIAAEEKNLEALLSGVREDREFLASSNSGGEFMDDDKVERIKEIAAKKFNFNGKAINYLTADEMENLLIRKGTLLESERKIMQGHAELSNKMLGKIPFIKKLQNVPRFAGGHHETLDGNGYPDGLKAEEIPLEARILALVDFYEALTASDRPYKKAMPIEKVMAILRSEVKKNRLDKDVFKLFESSGLYKIYAADASGQADKKS